MTDGKPIGRPSTFTPELAERICAELAEGKSLRAICRENGMPTEATVRVWARDDVSGFYSQYARSRDIGLDAMGEEVIEISDTATPEQVQVARLRSDNRKWFTSKLAPKRYGDRVGVQHSNDPENPMPGAMEPRELARELAFLLRKAAEEKA